MKFVRTRQAAEGIVGTVARIQGFQMRLIAVVLTRLTVLAVLLACAVPAQAGASTVVSLTFDDTLASQYQARQMLAARGMHGTFYVNSSRVGSGGYLTKTQLLSMQSDGNEIGGHSVNHLDLLTVDVNEQKRQVCGDRKTLLGWGFSARSFAYPFGADDDRLAQVVRDCGYNSGRDFEGLMASGIAAESIPPRDPYSIETVDEVGASTTLAELQAAVLDAEGSGGGWVVFTMHDICDACGPHAVSPSTLGAFLDWLAPRASGGTTVRTVGAVIGGGLTAAVAGPPPPAVRSGNMLLNPSLETDSDGNGMADCWHRNSWQTNSSTWTRTTDAHSGRFAEHLVVTSYTSGAVRLLSQQDLGFCAATAVAGRRYSLRAWYKGTAQPRLVGFYRNQIGAWKTLGQSAWLPRASKWKSGLWTTPTLPAGATGISIGVAIESTGSLTIDDLAITAG